MTTTAHLDAAAAATGFRGYRYKHGDRPLEGYTIQRAAGRGGFGEVYYAVSDGGREVALKVVQAFEQVELRGIGQCMNLKSPHLVTVFDVREGTDGQPIVIMEFVGGPSLRELLDDAPAGLGAQKAAFFLREIAKGLTYLHDCGIVHRDLKPANIFYENGYVKIGDYGLSKAISANHRSGQTVTVGTLHYMAPEVGIGRYDRSVDIYAFGALLYEMLTGQPPFFGASAAEVLMKHLGTLVDVTAVPEPFATVIKRAMAKDPDQRYATVQEMVEAVYGAEHVRQSVSCFSPDSLTLVAGRIADRLVDPIATGRAQRPVSSRAYAWEAQESAKHYPKWMAPVARRIAGLNARWQQWASRRSAEPFIPAPHAAEAVQLADPIPKRHRRLMALVLSLLIAVAGAVFTSGPRGWEGHTNGPAVGMIVFLCTLGGTFGVRWASVWLMPLLRNESRLLQHLAAGGSAACLALLAGLPAWASHGHLIDRSDQTFAALAASLLLLDWQKRTRPDRDERLPLSHLVVACGTALILGLILEAEVPVVIAVVCGVTVATEILSPWVPAGARGALAAPVRTADPSPSSPPPAPAPVATSEGAATDESKESTMAVTRIALGPLKFFASAPVTPAHLKRAKERSLLGTIVRLPILIVAFALLLSALGAAIYLAADVPGLLASGRVGPQIPHELERGFSTPSWPQVMRAIGGASLFALATVSAVLFMLVRRRYGGQHMARAALGIGLLVAAPFLSISRGDLWRSAPVFWNRQDWWQVFEDLLGHVKVHNAFIGGSAFAAAMVLLLWPSGPKPSRNESSPSTEPAKAMVN